MVVQLFLKKNLDTNNRVSTNTEWCSRRFGVKI